jgi:hypothetical protein
MTSQRHTRDVASEASRAPRAAWDARGHLSFSLHALLTISGGANLGLRLVSHEIGRGPFDRNHNMSSRDDYRNWDHRPRSNFLYPNGQPTSMPGAIFAHRGYSQETAWWRLADLARAGIVDPRQRIGTNARDGLR